jgi:hypothetical protein
MRPRDLVGLVKSLLVKREADIIHDTLQEAAQSVAPHFDALG